MIVAHLYGENWLGAFACQQRSILQLQRWDGNAESEESVDVDQDHQTHQTGTTSERGED
jgi:hypothetical protein